MVLQNKNTDKLKLSSMAPVKQKQIEKPKTTLNINSTKELSQTFPYSLETLNVRSVDVLCYLQLIFIIIYLGTASSQDYYLFPSLSQRLCETVMIDI